MNIQERLNSLKPHVFGMRFINDKSVVDVILKQSWDINAVSDPSISHKLLDAGKGYYAFFGDSSIDIDYVIDHVEKIININIDNEKKSELYESSVEKLKEFFTNHTLSELEGLYFNISAKTSNVSDVELVHDDSI